MNDKLIVIIIPCWNESETIYKVCKSLGFCSTNQGAKSNTHLVLVDNNSQDNTYKILEEIQAVSREYSVTIGFESEKGPIPTRIKGIEIATKIAQERKYSFSNVIILQADADVIYSQNYVTLMSKPFRLKKTNILVEGNLQFDKKLRDEHPNYIKLCEMVDDSFFKNLLHKREEVIVTDSICGYLLSDYYKWGGYHREFASDNDEILAESTKLFIKAKLQGAKKMRILNAIGEHSSRKIFSAPDVDFITSGFPKSEKWKKKWRKHYKGPTDIKYFNKEDLKRLKALDVLVEIRIQYLTALFKYLTGLVMLLNNKNVFKKKEKQLLDDFKSSIPSKKYLILYPGKILEFVQNRYVKFE